MERNSIATAFYDLYNYPLLFCAEYGEINAHENQLVTNVLNLMHHTNHCSLQ
jgi:hypothetical protein